MEAPAIHIQTDNGHGVYGDAIDLSNACRAFYQARLESTRRLKEKWKDTGLLNECDDVAGSCCRRRGSNSSTGSRRGSDSDGGSSNGGGTKLVGHPGLQHGNRKKSSLDVAIDLLRREMAALMDQDLMLMKQLLTLNEEIEDLKWRRRHGWSRASSFCSSDNMIQSAASLIRVDEHPTLEFSTPSSLSLQLDNSTNRLSIYNDDDPIGTFNRVRTTATILNRPNGAMDNSNDNNDNRSNVTNDDDHNNQKSNNEGVREKDSVSKEEQKEGCTCIIQIVDSESSECNSHSESNLPATPSNHKEAVNSSLNTLNTKHTQDKSAANTISSNKLHQKTCKEKEAHEKLQKSGTYSTREKDSSASEEISVSFTLPIAVCTKDDTSNRTMSSKTESVNTKVYSGDHGINTDSFSSSPNLDTGTEMSSEFEVKSQDSGIHDCFGTI